jgi:hypothetical protein
MFRHLMFIIKKTILYMQTYKVYFAMRLCKQSNGLRLCSISRLRLKCDGTRAETRFRLSAKWTRPFIPVWESVQSTTGNRGVRISGSNAGYTKFRGSVKSIGYPLHSPVSPSLLLPCVTVYHHISTGLYYIRLHLQYSLPEDEHKIIETCRKQEELNLNINLKSVFCCLTIHNCITICGTNTNFLPSAGYVKTLRATLYLTSHHILLKRYR